MGQASSVHGVWSKRWTFVLAATGSAVGLGNIWKFPYIAGENGGGAFVLVYLFCIAAIGIPIMMGEVLLGRMGRQSPVNTMLSLAKTVNASCSWVLVGVSGVLAGFFILSFYSVIAGWALAYVVKAVSGSFVDVSAQQIGQEFDALLHSPSTLLFWHSLFMLMTCTVIAKGINRGLQATVYILMPLLFALMLVMLGYSMTSGNFEAGAAFLFNFDPSKLSGEALLVAMGHAFFTLSLGMGAIMVYGAYMPANESIGKMVVAVGFLDTAVALAAGLVIFPIVFANQLDPGAGPGLMFVTLPIAFGQMPAGSVFATVFFVLVVFAAWSSSISLLEPAVAWLVEHRGLSRLSAAMFSGVACWLLGLGTVISFNVASEWTLWDKTFFDLLDFLASNVMLPLGGLAMAVFVAWILPLDRVREQLQDFSEGLLALMIFILKYVAPALVLAVFARSIGVL